MMQTYSKGIAFAIIFTQFISGLLYIIKYEKLFIGIIPLNIVK